MISASIVRALEVISDRLNPQNLRWVLVGSTSLALQGVDVTPGDIDILTDKADAYKINELLKDFELEPVAFRQSNAFRSHLGKFHFKNVKVEVMGDYQEKVKGKWQDLNCRLAFPVIIQFNGMQLPVSSLESHLSSYESSGREEDAIKVTAIRVVLNNR